MVFVLRQKEDMTALASGGIGCQLLRDWLCDFKQHHCLSQKASFPAPLAKYISLVAKFEFS